MKTPVFWIKGLRKQISKRLKTGFLLEAIKVLWALEEWDEIIITCFSQP